MLKFVKSICPNMETREQLFRLIKSLSKNEKRYFKVFAQKIIIFVKFAAEFQNLPRPRVGLSKPRYRHGAAQWI